MVTACKAATRYRNNITCESHYVLAAVLTLLFLHTTAVAATLQHDQEALP
jgi:hypothetical protein